MRSYGRLPICVEVSQNLAYLQRLTKAIENLKIERLIAMSDTVRDCPGRK